jgi:diadenosine tetraphosphate (Ap4A) HIT family hydrolase
MDDCVFCQIVAGKASARRVYEDEHTLAFLDLHPISRGVPRYLVWVTFEDKQPEEPSLSLLGRDLRGRGFV